MLSTGRIDLVVKTTNHIYVIELKLRNNGGKEAAIKQIQDRQYLEPFKADKREVVGLGIELDEEGKGIFCHTNLSVSIFLYVIILYVPFFNVVKIFL